ncbi:hypothetical protein OSB04_013082 [Centaurea solstitialis]|uniref:Uncharacterized protein n=1 Tax=Centaurea solstitialis TaxID=347529 RepID=A0AA38TK42_9ASTR|nr:hypothetical protein OSB04_013082 [Centaurea solstitialis]
MSVNQSRGDKNEPPQYRKFGRSGGNAPLQRNYSGGKGGGGGGNTTTTAPPSSSSNRSFKKVGNYAQGVQQPRVNNSPNTNSNPDLLNSSTAPGGTTVPNGAHLQPPPRGAAGAPAAVPAATIKPSDVPTQKSTPGLPRAPQGNAAVSGSDATGPSTPTKGPAFPLQFGSISPGLMNGMQIPARTSSAPPNLDEQKQAQVSQDGRQGEAFRVGKLLEVQIPNITPTKTMTHRTGAKWLMVRCGQIIRKGRLDMELLGSSDGIGGGIGFIGHGNRKDKIEVGKD